MKILKLGIVIFALLLSLPASWPANPQEKQFSIQLSSNATYLVDTTKLLSIDTITSPTIQGRFSSEVPASADAFIWIKLAIPAEVPVGSYCFYILDTEYKEIYFKENTQWQAGKNGALMPPAERSVPQNPRYLCFGYAKEQPFVYLKVTSSEQLTNLLKGIVLETKVYSLAEAAKNTNLSFRLTGAMLMVILCSLAFYVLNRDTGFLLFAVFLMLFYVMVNKVFLTYLWGDHWPFFFLNPYINQVFFILTPLSLLVFARSYFVIRQQSIFWKRIFNGALLLSLVCFSTLAMSESINSTLILLYNVMVALIISWYASIAYFKLNYQPSLYFLLGFLVPLVAIVMIVLNYFGVWSIANLNLVADFSVLTLSLILAIGVMQRFRQTQADLLEVTKVNMMKEHETQMFKLKNSELITHNEVIEAQRRQIEDQATTLKEVNGTKDKLLTIVSHDLIGPVNNLRFIISQLSERQMTADEFHSLSERLKKDVENSHTILHNVLKWTETHREGIVTHPSHFDIRKLVYEVIEFVNPQSKAKKISIEVIPHPETQVYADHDQVHIILRNFLTNAIKFGKEGSRVFVNVWTDDAQVMVSVEDQGVGMAPEVIEKIIHDSKISSTPGTLGEKGTGLGLLLCKEFISKNNGQFYIESKENNGTKVSFSLKKS